MITVRKIIRQLKLIRDGNIQKQWAILKEDIDVYASRFEYKDKFPKGYQNYSYFKKFFKLFFGKNCFRYVVYFRLGPWARFVKPIFRVPYDSTIISCTTHAVGGGHFPYACIWDNLKL